MSDMQLGGARPRLDPHSPDAGVPTLSALPGAGPLGGGRFLNGQMARRTCWLLMWRGRWGTARSVLGRMEAGVCQVGGGD